MKTFQSIFKNHNVLIYLRFFAIGMGISIVTLILNSSFQIMGVDLSEFKYLFFSFLPLFLKDYIQTLIANGILFGILGLLITTAFNTEDKDQTSFQQNSVDQFAKKENTIQSKILNYKNIIFKTKLQATLSNENPTSKRRFFFSKELLVFGIFIFLLWCHSIIVYPQLYGEFFFYRFGFLRFFLFLLTDQIHPRIPQSIALTILCICVLFHAIVLIKNKEFIKLIFLLFVCIFLVYFHSLGSLLGIFIVTLAYLFTRIFENQIILPNIEIKKVFEKPNRTRTFLFLLFLLFLIYFYFSGNGIGIFIVSFACLTVFLFKNIKVSMLIGSISFLFAVVSLLNARSITKTEISPVFLNLPNILILSADSLRYDKMGYAQGKEGMTPNIDLLSKDSIIFEDHHTTIPRTFPAWADLLTGQPSFIHGIQDMFPDRKDREGLTFKTLPKLLSQLGYKTNVVSSFAGDIFPRADWGFRSVQAPIFHAGTFTSQRILETQIFLLPIVTGSVPGAGEYFPAIRGLPSLGDDSKILPDLWNSFEKNEEPFFTVFFSSVTHFPFSPPYPHYKNFTNLEYYGKFKYFKFVDPGDSSEPSLEDKEQIRGLFQASIYSFDQTVGKVVERLKKKGIYDSTLIVLTSDHGESLFEADHNHGHGEHLRGEGVTHIPLLIKLPKNLGAGIRFSGISSSLDLFPTLLTFVSKEIQNPSIRNQFLKELSSRSGRDLSFALNSTTWKDSRNVYGETGIWFSDLGDHFFQKERIFYPSILHLHSIESGELPFISIGDSYAKESIIVSKHRMFQNSNRKLIYIPSEDGVIWRCYDRINDPWNVKPLSNSECSTLKDSLISFLISSGKFKKVGEYLFPL
ncbi:type I phosphodiesterase/nucleotide pyrophosphatase [Leptospira interrogans str. 2003000735]|uniref:Type I phosphodiesterase/nucleotide pyrophosphatase n=1 Tax=Leptospira interrogans str. 2002000626 TaxID=996803 RepID=A0A829D341_LEPIR|nr:sulfatase-like hydrolase/transferase [Leptospira interrogans]EMY03188.1 type I phosphodiesterase/nucleotide pyrophosphatase [Leptospira interrogans str. 2002000626]EKN89706.1 type I phosphodiesterase/nucleotide pyrophosphatase [Leptospira interrogans str. 2002000624]EKQ37505.1 type I phosphodiesterase/nucleotide pyrophosphatase [Leptospira interrogans str. 2002000621]EKQ47012.1 type I phosphodiesterase/nucleotide pyrophosphatase [Leptospira interrogans str. 2002000623]EMJ69490.1 type I phos